IAEDADGALWIGTTRGIAQMRGDKVSWVTVRDGLPGNTIFQTLDDSLGYLWLSGPWGVARVSRANFAESAERHGRSFAAKQLGRDDGMAAREASSISRAWR